jgi:hypothetical protein
MRYAWLAPILVLASASACAEAHRYEEGTICLDPAAPADFQDGGALELTIILDDCMRCPKEFDARCDVHREGQVITVEAGGFYEPKTGGCSSCIELKTSCTVGDLPLGTYTIRSGSEELKVTLPSPDPVQLDPLCAKVADD